MREKLISLKGLTIPAAIVLLSIPASLQILEPGYFSAHDSVLHLLRTIEFDAELGAGNSFPRWSRDLALGYGYPLLNFYPPLTYYLSQTLHLLGLGYGDALKAVSIGGLALSGLGMYLFTRDLFGSRPAALLSAVSFIYFPYHLTDVYVRGAIPEATLIVLMPFALWAFHRVALYARLRYAILGGFILASLILTHVISLFFLPMVAAYTLLIVLLKEVSYARPNSIPLSASGGPRGRGGVPSPFGKGEGRVRVPSGRNATPFPLTETVHQAGPNKRQALLLTLWAILLGLSLSAFYWLPVLLEKQHVSVVSSDWVIGDTIKDELLAPASLVQHSLTYDYQAKFPPRLAAIDLVLTVVGLVFWLASRNRRELLPSLTAFLAMTLALIFLLSTASLPIWRQAPLIGLIQFPWRLLAFVGLATSVFAGLIARRGRSSYLVASLVAIVIILANTWGLKLDGLEFPDDSLSLGTLARFEYDTGIMGTAYANEWLPGGAKSGFTSPLYGATAAPEFEGAAASVAGFQRVGPLSYRARVVAGEPARLRFHGFFFPGWQAKVGGSPVETYPSTNLGLITFDLPAGQHEMTLSFEDTPVRVLGRAISIAALALVSLIGSRAGRRSRSPARYTLACVPLLLAGSLLIPPSLMVQPATSPSFAERQPVDFAGRLRLLGFEADTSQFGQNGKIALVLYWQTLRTMEENLQMTLEAFDGQGKQVGGQRGAPIYSTALTSAWSVNEIVRDRREMRLLPESFLSRTGPVSLRLAVWAGRELLGSVPLGEFDIPPLPATNPSGVRTFPAGQSVGVSFGDVVLLRGYDAEPPRGFRLRSMVETLAPSLLHDDSLRVTLFWQWLAAMDEDYVVSVRLVGPEGELVSYHDSQPQNGFKQTSLWQPGELVEDVHLLKIPVEAETGTYQLEVFLYQHLSDAKLWPEGGSSPTLTLGPVVVPPG